MIKLITPGCSVRLRNGTVVHNIHHCPWNPPCSEISALHPGSKPLKGLCDLQRLGNSPLGWWECGSYHIGSASELDIMEVLTKKEVMTIPEYDSPEFGEHMKLTHEAFLRDKRVQVKAVSADGWQTTTLPSWNWDQFDYKPMDKPKYTWFTLEEVLPVLSQHFLIRREDTKQVYTAHYSVHNGKVVVCTPFTTITEDLFLYQTGIPAYEYSNDNVTWKELAC